MGPGSVLAVGLALKETFIRNNLHMKTARHWEKVENHIEDSR